MFRGKLTSSVANNALDPNRSNFRALFKDEIYREDGGGSTFADAITHSASTNATMTSGYGPELVTNGTFDSDTGWTVFGTATFSGGAVTMSSATVVTPVTLTVGKMYDITVVVSGGSTNGTVRAGSTQGGLDALQSTAMPTAGSYSFQFKAITATTYISLVSTNSFTVDNISVREMPAIKWRPHNLLTYSEDFSQSAYIKDPGVSIGTTNNADPSGGTSATQINVTDNGRIYRNETVVPAKAAIFIKAGSFAHFAIHTADVDLVAKTASSGTLTELDNGWFLFVGEEKSVIRPFQIQAYPDNTYSIHTDSGNYYIWGAHMYRSDLGGMVDNPDRGDSYVPTTSSAVYLPRRGHHIYNGYEWVNEGMLHESEARTNLFTNSLDMGVSFTPYGGDTETRNDSGKTTIQNTTTATSYEENTASGRKGQFNSVSQTAGVMYTYSQVVHSTNRDFVGIGAYQATVHGVGVRYQLSTGISQTFSTGTNGTIHGHNLEDLGNGWYRISLTYDIATTAADLVWVYSFTSLTPTVGSYGTETYAGTAGYKTYWDHTQIEVGATPSSYIPTSGATVTRAAESLIIPAANLPWPTPNVIGSELVTNGDFSGGLTGWTQYSGAPSDIDTSSGAAVFTHSSTNVGAYQEIATEAGKVYQLTADVTLLSGNPGNVALNVWNGAFATLISNNAPPITTADPIVFVALGTVTRVVPYIQTSGTSASFDNISVKEIDPLSVSIQMNGRMTYADDDQTIFAAWSATGVDLIQIALQDSVDRLRFRQAIGGVFDDVLQSPITSYSPGVFVPFNIASRHGSTFINGAADGVALTANTTPTALPDLSTTDLNLGYDFMGTIKEFQIWNKDIGDDIVTTTEPSLEPSLYLTFDGTAGSFTVTDWSE